MNMDAFLSRLQHVTPRGSRHVALCPAHADRSPSLQITEGDRCILVKCWAGCTLEEICAALAIRPADLFYDAGLPHTCRPIKKAPRLDRTEIAFQFELGALDRRLRAEAVLAAAHSRDALIDAQQDRLMNAVACAYQDLDEAERLEDLSEVLREGAWRRRIQRQHVA